MRNVALVIAVLVGLIAPSRRPEVRHSEGMNAKWIELSNKYVFPWRRLAPHWRCDLISNGLSAMVKGRAEMGGNVERHGGASERSEGHDP